MPKVYYKKNERVLVINGVEFLDIHPLQAERIFDAFGLTQISKDLDLELDLYTGFVRQKGKVIAFLSPWCDRIPKEKRFPLQEEK